MSHGIKTSLFCALALLTLQGCFSVQSTENFLVVREDRDDIRFITADESKLWIREFDDEDEGDFDFWSKALENDFVNNRGYTLLESKDVADKSGRPGREMTFEVTTEGRTYRYLVTMFVVERLFHNVVRVAEYVAEKDRFESYLQEVRDTIAKVRT